MISREKKINRHADRQTDEREREKERERERKRERYLNTEFLQYLHSIDFQESRITILLQILL